MKRKIVSGIMLTLLLIGMLTLAFYIQPVKSEPTTWTVDDDGPAHFTSVQEAINAANPGDTIYVYNGTYNEHVVVNKTLSLIGENREATVINGSRGWGAKVVSITANNVTVSGFTIQNSGPSIGLKDSGIYIINSSNNNVSNNFITNNLFGVVLSWSSSNILTFNVLLNHPQVGIWLEHSSNNMLSNNWVSNEVREVTMGITLHYSSNNNTLANNKVLNNRFGISLYHSNNNMLANNVASNNTVRGIGLYNSSNNIIGNNTVSSNIESGISLSYSCNNTFVNNTVSNNNNGILLGLSCNNTFVNNVVSNNNYGISIQSSSNNTVYHNNFINNALQVYERYHVSTNIWDDGYPSGGNCWSDYDGTDFYSGLYQNETGSDGIGDTPYLIDVNNQDRYPVVILTIPEVVFTLADTTHFNVTVQNSEKSPLYVNINRITVTLDNGIIFEITSTLPMLPYGLHRNEVVTFLCSWNWFNYQGRNVTVTVYSLQGYSAEKTTITPIRSPDINGDGIVDIHDVVIAAIAFGSKLGDPNWNPNADLNDDGLIDIFDMVIMGVNYGKTW